MLKGKPFIILVLIIIILPAYKQTFLNNENIVVLPIPPPAEKPTQKITGIAGDTPRAPISIIGDASFTGANGVVGGTGTEQDPYLIADWLIDGNGVDNCIQINNTTSYFVIENCTLFNTTATNTAGIQLVNVSNGYLRSNECNNSWYGINLYNSSYITLTNNTCINSEWIGIRVEVNSLYNSLIQNNCSSSLGSHGIALYTDSHYNTLINNTCIDNIGYGMNIQTFNNTVTNNTCNGNVYGILLEASSSNTLTNNICQENTAGIRIRTGASNNTLTNNLCTNNTVGITVGWAAAFNTFTNNTCSDNVNHGIFFWGNSTSNIVTSNICSDNSMYGIFLEHSRENNITRNHISNNAFSGICLNT